MPKLNFYRLVLMYYSGFFPATFAITVICAFLCFQFSYSAWVVIFWFKVIATGLIGSYIHSYKKQEYVYYQNLRVPELRLWAWSLGIDKLLFVLVIFLIAQFK